MSTPKEEVKLIHKFKEDKDDDKFCNWIKFEELTKEPYTKGSDGVETLKDEFKYFMQCVTGTNPGPKKPYLYEKILKDDALTKKKTFEEAKKDYNLFQDSNAFQMFKTEDRVDLHEVINLTLNKLTNTFDHDHQYYAAKDVAMVISRYASYLKAQYKVDKLLPFKNKIKGSSQAIKFAKLSEEIEDLEDLLRVYTKRPEKYKDKIVEAEADLLERRQELTKLESRMEPTNESLSPRVSLTSQQQIVTPRESNVSPNKKRKQSFGEVTTIYSKAAVDTVKRYLN
jgi:hypothetical protein